MTDPRYDAARAKLRRFLPPPPPDSGWGYARQRIAAEFLGVLSDDQAAIAESMMLMPAVLTRTDSSPTSWSTDEHTWTFAPTVPAYQGAQGDWLDLWGTTLSVPRETGEPDGLYGPRILSELLRPTTTNIGLAQAIDEGLGIVGTEVLEAADVLTIYRLNSPGLRLNAATGLVTKRLNMAGAFGGTSLWCCFIVRIPTGAQQPYDEATIRRLADRRKAAGTRLVGIYTATGGAILTPDAVTVGVSTTAWIQPIAGATYLWTVTGGVIESGQGTNSIQWHATAQGQVGISLLVTLPSGGTNYWKPVQAFNAINPAISTALYQMAGTFAAVASIAPPGNGFTILWSATGLDLEGPMDQPVVTFDVGQAGTLATLTVTLRSGAGATGTSSVQIKSVPYTSTASVVTATLPTKAEQDIDVDLGWEWELVHVDVDRPAWVRIYNTAADRAADASRSITSDPLPTTKIVWEGIFETLRTIQAAPNVKGVNGDTPRVQTAYLSVTNLDATSAPVNVSITRTETRTSGTF